MVGGIPLTIYGSGFDALAPVRQAHPDTASTGRCRFGGPNQEVNIYTPGRTLNDNAFTCESPPWLHRRPGVQVRTTSPHPSLLFFSFDLFTPLTDTPSLPPSLPPSLSPVCQPIDISLNALIGRVDFDFIGGRPSPIFFTFARPHTLSSVLPAGGPVHGGTRLYVKGTGLLAYARSSPSVCLLSHPHPDELSIHEHPLTLYTNLTSPATRRTSALARCVAPPSTDTLPTTVPLRLSLNGDEIHPLPDATDGPVFSYYVPPTLVQLQPTSGPTSGNQLVTIVVLGLNRYGSKRDALCRFGDSVVPARIKTNSVLVCGTPPRLAGTVPVLISINGQDFSENEVEPLEYTFSCSFAGEDAQNCVADPGCGFCELPPPPSVSVAPPRGGSGGGGDGGSSPPPAPLAPCRGINPRLLTCAPRGHCLPRTTHTCEGRGTWIERRLSVQTSRSFYRIR